MFFGRVFKIVNMNRADESQKGKVQEILLVNDFVPKGPTLS